jgi:triosephosphate isomerase
MTTPLIVGNWKMNTSLDEAITLARAAAAAADGAGSGTDVGICPPFTWIVPVSDAVRGSSVRVGAQDCSDHDNGAYTGDISATMLASCCTFTLVGHSERRSVHGETDDLVQQKLHEALDAGLDVILCVGESAEERNMGLADRVVLRQLDSTLDRTRLTDTSRLTIAYEPVWAIGIGVAATEADASQMATLIREDLDARFGSSAEHIRILYGGSANDRNALAFLAAKNVDGLLVGSASLSPEVFASIVESARITP